MEDGVGVAHELAGLWYVLVQDRGTGWRHDEEVNEAELWLESIGAPERLAGGPLRPRLDFTLVGGKAVFRAIARGLRVLASGPADGRITASDARSFADRIDDDAAMMTEVDPAAVGRPVGVVPWCFDDFEVWWFENLSRSEARMISEAAHRHPGLSEPLVARYEDMMLMGSDAGIAMVLADGLDLLDDPDPEIRQVVDSLRRWIERADPLPADYWESD